MAAQQQESVQGGDPSQVWRDVAALIARVNALENMSVKFQSANPTAGKLEINGDSSVLTLL